MDYFQTTDRYRKREFRNLISIGFRLMVVGFAIWLGWFWGHNQRAAVTADTNQQMIRLNQQNERLEQKLATTSAALDAEKQRRIEVELLAESNESNSSLRSLNRQMARYLSKGVSEDQIRLSLQTLSKPLRCRPLEKQDIAVATSFFAGKEAMADLLGGGMRVFIEGEAGREATRDKPWFDPERPVSIRIAYLNGEKIATGTLPFETNVIADSWLIQIKASPASLQGYATLGLSKCSLN